MIGIDVGGTKCAGGVVEFPEGRVVARRLVPTRAERDGAIVLADVISMAQSLRAEAMQAGAPAAAIGIGVAELVDSDGTSISNATNRWRGIQVSECIRAGTGLPARLDADVRAAARAEGRLGAGCGLADFLYVTVGTGISSALVLRGSPYLGARGLTGTFASSPGLIPGDAGGLAPGPPLERFAAGPALAARLTGLRPSFHGSGADVAALAAGGDELAQAIVASAGRALGAAVAQLVNTLDPSAVVLGGGLGSAGGFYREMVEQALRELIWSDGHRDLPLLTGHLGNDAGWIGAALGALP
jgi:glucokinase